MVTVLLHYFFLAAFCWMLCEGIMIYILLVKVFYNGFFKQLPFHMAIGWGAYVLSVHLHVHVCVLDIFRCVFCA